jgi:hypothetical protein
MNPQRYGDIDTSAGKGTTEEAIVRSSMGSVIIFTMFEKFLEKEYLADLEYSKVAYINGKKGSYTDNDGNTKFLDLDIDKHILANYGLHVVSSVTQNEKKRKLENLAFAAAQNGEFKLGIEAVLSDNIASIKKAFEDFEEANKQYKMAVDTEKERLNAEANKIKADNDAANRASQLEMLNIKEYGETERVIIKGRIDLLALENSAKPDDVANNNNNMKNEIAARKLELDKMQQDLDMRKHNDTMAMKDKELKVKEKAITVKNNNNKSKK